MAIVQTEKGINTYVTVGSIEVGGQDRARLLQTVQQTDITNMIEMKWSRIVTNVKSWSVVCNGLAIKDDEGFKALQDAFNNNSLVDVTVQDGNITKTGQAYVTSFPIDSVFKAGWTYAVTLQGSGALA